MTASDDAQRRLTGSPGTGPACSDSSQEGSGYDLQDFRIFWRARGVSLLGSAVSAAVLPLVAVIVLGATPLMLGVLAATAPAGMIVGRFAAAIAADRSNRPLAVLVALDLTQAALLVAVPVLWAGDWLSVDSLIAVTGLLGLASGAANAYANPLLVQLVPSEALVTANGRLATAATVADVAGPGIAGLLVRLAAIPVALLFDAVSFILSAFAYGALARRRGASTIRTAGQPREPGLRSVVSGFAAPLHDPQLRGQVIALAAVTFVNGAIIGQLSLYMIRGLGLSPTLASVLLAAGGIGGIIGGITVGRVVSKLGTSSAFTLSFMLTAGCVIGLPLATGRLSGVIACVVYEFVGSLGATYLVTVVFSSLQQRLPRGKLARGLAAASLIPELGAILGSILGGVVAEHIGVRNHFELTAYVGAVLATMALLRLLSGFVRLKSG